MRSSHGDGGAIPIPVLEKPTDILLEDNQADISGVATGESSDALNDRLGRPREGQISPGLPQRYFPPMRIASDTNEPNNQNERKQRQEVVALASWHKDAPKPDAFVPIVAEDTGVPGWIAAIDGEWYPVEVVQRISIAGGRVSFFTNEAESREVMLADFGPDTEAAKAYRVKAARNLSKQLGWTTEE